MLLEELLKEKRSTILKSWFRSILESYPADAAKKFGQVEDRFHNPVGSSISQAIEIIYDELLGDMDRDTLNKSLDEIIRIRSVQDFHPSQAIAFPLLLKKVIRTSLYQEIVDRKLTEKLFEFESRIDQMSMLAFDIYMQCREKIFDLKLQQKEGMFTPVDRLNRRRKATGPESDI
jgi:hypothetical protein